MTEKNKSKPKIPREFIPHYSTKLFIGAIKTADPFSRIKIPSFPKTNLKFNESLSQIKQNTIRLNAFANTNIDVALKRIIGPYEKLDFKINKSFAIFKKSEEIATSLRNFEKAIKNQIRFIEEQAIQSKMIAKVVGDSYVGFREKMQKWFTEADQAVLWLQEVNWPPLPGVPLALLIRLMKSCQGKSIPEQKEIANKGITRYYKKAFSKDEMLSRWKKYLFLKEKIHILEEAIEAHVQGKYALCVTATLPQIEGVFAKNFGHTGYMAEKKYRSYLEKLLKDHSSFGMSEIAIKFIFGVFLANFLHGHTVVYDLNRHAILHGADTSYGKVVSSLKAILLLDFIISQFNFVSLCNSSVFHKVGCKVVKQNGKDRVFYSHEFQAKAHNKKPCKICCKNIKIE